MHIDNCPNCQGMLRVAAKQCAECGLEMRGDFTENALNYLSRIEQDFLLQFVLSAGNFKALGERLDLTYPTLRIRLDKIIARLDEIAALQAPDEILDAVQQGALKPEDAIKQLRRMLPKKETA